MCSKTNVFVKPNEQCRACSDIVMARKRTFEERKKKVNTPLMYEVLNKDTMKYEILPHLSVEKRGYVSKSDPTEVIQNILYKPGNWLLMADYFCVCMMLSSLAMSSMLCNRSC